MLNFISACKQYLFSDWLISCCQAFWCRFCVIVQKGGEFASSVAHCPVLSGQMALSVQGAGAEVSLNRFAHRLCDLYYSPNHMCDEKKLCLNQNMNLKKKVGEGGLTTH